MFQLNYKHSYVSMKIKESDLFSLVWLYPCLILHVHKEWMLTPERGNRKLITHSRWKKLGNVFHFENWNFGLIDSCVNFKPKKNPNDSKKHELFWFSVILGKCLNLSNDVLKHNYSNINFRWFMFQSRLLEVFFPFSVLIFAHNWCFFSNF